MESPGDGFWERGTEIRTVGRGCHSLYYINGVSSFVFFCCCSPRSARDEMRVEFALCCALVCDGTVRSGSGERAAEQKFAWQRNSYPSASGVRIYILRELIYQANGFYLLHLNQLCHTVIRLVHHLLHCEFMVREFGVFGSKIQRKIFHLWCGTRFLRVAGNFDISRNRRAKRGERERKRDWYNDCH